MKRLLTIALTLVMALTLFGCGGKSAPSVAPSVGQSIAPSASQSVTPSVAPSAAPSATPSLEPSVAPSLESSVAPTVLPSVTPQADCLCFDAVLPYYVHSAEALEMEDDWILEPIAPMEFPLQGELPIPSAREGYTFLHWSATERGEAITLSEVAAPTVLYAVWQADESFVPLSSAEEFAAMQPDGKYLLTADITVTAPYEAAFTGTLDGNGHTITLAIESSDSAALFKSLERGGKVYNLSLNGSVSSKKYAASVAVESYYGLIFRCSFNGTVTGTFGAGGILYSNMGHVTLCKTQGRVEGNGLLGGVCGTSGMGKFFYCTSSSAIKNQTAATIAGGICGDLSLTAFNTIFFLSRADYCYFNGSIEIDGIKGTSSNAGGIAGRAMAYISDCYADFALSVKEPFGSPGGLVGKYDYKTSVDKILYQTVLTRSYYAPTCTYYNEKKGVARPSETLSDEENLAPEGFVSAFFTHSRAAVRFLLGEEAATELPPL